MPFFRPAFGAISAAAALTLLASPPSSRAADAQWDRFVHDFIERSFALDPSSAVGEGRHEFDGLLPDWSDAALATQISWLHAEQSAADHFPGTALDARQNFEREYLVAECRRQLFWIETIDQPHTNPYWYADAIDPDPYVSREYAPLPVRLRAYTRYARNVPAALVQIRHNLDRPVAKSLLAIGRTTIGGLADFYANDVPKVFAPVADPALQADFRAANAGAIRAVKEFDAWMAEREKTAADRFQLGPERFRAMVRETEGVDLPVERLQAIGQRDLDRNLAAMRAACAAYAPGLSVHDAARRAFAHKPEGGIVPYATRQLHDLRRFIVDHDLVSIPGKEQAVVKLAPPYKGWNSAYIEIPGPYEKNLPSAYRVSPPDPTWSREKQAAYEPGVGPLLFTSAHEVYPGHFVQYLHAHRVPSKFGQIFVGYAFSEGWAHYAEEMMWDAGLGGGTPEMHIGQLEEALLRNVRFMAAIGLHTGGMTVDQARRMFIDQGFQDEADAEQQANRGTFDPAYLNYTLGKLMIMKLRADWTATRGGRKAWKEFHDRFLSYGGPPIPLVRKAMLGAAAADTLF